MTERATINHKEKKLNLKIKKRDKKNRPKMKVTGKSVQKIQQMIGGRSKKKS